MPQETKNNVAALLSILEMAKFKELLNASIKSKDTEEWLDMRFNRPVGLVMALAGKKLGIHPTAITAVSIILGVWAAFPATELIVSLIGAGLFFRIRKRTG